MNTDPRRICLVTETYPPEINGVALTLARLADGLRARGHAVSVVRPRQPSDGRVGGERGRDPELTLVSGFAAARVQGGARRSARGAGHCGTAGASGARTPCTWRPRGRSDGPPCGPPTDWACPCSAAFIRTSRTTRGHYGLGWLAPVVQGYLRRLHNRTRGTLVASAELRRRLLGIGFNDVHVLGRGVDGELFDPARRTAGLRATWGAGSEDLVALYVGRLAPEKNVPLAVEAYRAMQRVQSAARCVIVGDGPLRGDLAEGAPRPRLLRDAHGRGPRRPLRLGRRLPVPERDGDVRERHARGDGERPGRRGVRLRGGPHPRRPWRIRRAGAARGCARLRRGRRGARSSARVPARDAPARQSARGLRRLAQRGGGIRGSPDRRARGAAGSALGSPSGAVTSSAGAWASRGRRGERYERRASRVKIGRPI